MYLKNLKFLPIVLAALVGGVVACGEKSNSNTLIVGTMAGPETEIIEVAQTIAEKQYGLTVKLIEFSDYNLPNAALQDGTLDMNIFQHLPYLEDAIQTHHYDIKAIGKTFLYPMAVYSQKHKTLNDLKPDATIAIPNDPSNETRALLLLQTAGLIELKHRKTLSTFDIRSNPHHYQFRELDAAQLPRVLPDVDAAVINTTFAIPAGLQPNRDALFIEKKDSPYANLIVIRKGNSKQEKINQFIAAIHSPEVTAKAKTLFSDAAIPAW